MRPGPALRLAALFSLAALAPLRAAEAPRPVISEIVSADAARARTFPGVIQAAHETALAFQTIGRVATLAVDVGDRVTKGQTLATLDRVTLEEDQTSAAAALNSARAQADYAATVLSRTRALHDRHIASDADLEAAEADANSAEAQRAAAAAELAKAREALGYGTLLAPNDGVVVSRAVEAGTVVAAGTTILTLADLDGREAVIDVPAEYLAVLPKDAVFDVTEHADGAATVQARLRLVEPVAEDTLRSRRLRLTLPVGTPPQRIGGLITARLAASDGPIITLPLTALAGTDAAPVVWRVDPGDRRVHAVPVVVGPRFPYRATILSGVTEGDEVVVKGVHSLVEGQQVGERIQ